MTNENSCSTTFILVWSSVHYLSFLSTLTWVLLMFSFNAAQWWISNRFFKLMLAKSENDWVNEVMMLTMIAWCCARFFVEFNWNSSLLLQEIWSSKASASFVKMMKVDKIMLLKDMQILLSKDEITTSRKIVSWSWCLKNTFTTSLMMIIWVKDAEVSRMKRN